MRPIAQIRQACCPGFCGQQPIAKGKQPETKEHLTPGERKAKLGIMISFAKQVWCHRIPRVVLMRAASVRPTEKERMI
jgi:hypothetical protein